MKSSSRKRASCYSGSSSRAEGQGKSSGFRTILLLRRCSKEFFVDGFAKSDRDDIRRDELKAFRRLAGQMLTLDDKALAAAMRNGTIMEIECHG